MFTPKQYRSKAAEYTDRGKPRATLPRFSNFGRLSEASPRSRTMSSGFPTISARRCIPRRKALLLAQSPWLRKKSMCFGVWELP